MTRRTTETPAAGQSPDERAALLRAELAELEAAELRRQQAAAARLADHQTAFDEEVVAAYPQRRPALEAAVEQARAHLDEAIAADPVTQALAGFYTAAAARRQAFDELIGALARQGRDVAGVQHPPTHTVDLAEVTNRAAENAAADWRTQAETDFHTRRNNPNPKEQT